MPQRLTLPPRATVDPRSHVTSPRPAPYDWSREDRRPHDKP